MLAAAPAEAEEPWGFEQVTPQFKGSAAIQADTFQTSPDGRSFLYTMSSPLPTVLTESTPMYMRYHAHRGDDAWHSRGTDAPFYPMGFGSNAIQTTLGVSQNLDWVLVVSQVALTPGATDRGGNFYLANTRTGERTLIATSSSLSLATGAMGPQGQIIVKYVANDGKAVIFLSTVALIPGAPAGSNTYTWTEENGLNIDTALPQDEGGATVAGSYVGYYGEESGQDSVPREGGLEHLYFTTSQGNQGSGPLYVRSRDSGESKLVSASRVTGEPATPVRAIGWATSDHGRFVVFAARDSAVLTDDTPTDLLAAYPSSSGSYYLYDRENDDLRWVGAVRGTTGMGGFEQMTHNGQSVTFTSEIVLADGAVQGSTNLYVWRNGELKFVAVNPSRALRQLSPDGRYLAFTDASTALAAQFGTNTVSSSCLITANANDPGVPGPCAMMYRYDTETEELLCLTCRPGGPAPRGHTYVSNPNDSRKSRMMSYLPQYVTDDGTVFFTSPDDLIAADGNGLPDAYAYRDGELELVSRASAGMSARFLDATPDGKSVFLATNDPVTPTDTDRAWDIYVTRKGGGFTYTPPAVEKPCQGSDCREGSGSTDQSGEGPTLGSRNDGSGNVDPGPAQRRANVAARVASQRGAVAQLRLRVSSAGRITVAGGPVRNVKRRVGRSGPVSVPVRLSKRAAQRLKKSGRFRARVRVVFRPETGGRVARSVVVNYRVASKSGAARGSSAKGEK